MQDTEISSGWVLAGILAIISTLTSTVAFLYKKMSDYWKEREVDLKAELKEFKEETNKRFSELNQRAATCEQDRIAILLKNAALEQRINDLELTKKNRDSLG